MQPGDRSLDYFPCHYGASRLTFRGPRRDLTGEYLAMLGGAETYGRLVPLPFAALLEKELGLPAANLACPNAGPDLYLGDRAALEVAAGARLAVVQLTGGHNISNRFYRVHGRRNDRFIAATPVLRALYRDVDFTEIHFTRHLLSVLAAKCDERFDLVLQELKTQWVQRMIEVLEQLPYRRLLLWLADHPPAEAGARWAGGAGTLIDREMIAALQPYANGYAELVIAPPPSLDGQLISLLACEGRGLGLPDATCHRQVAELLLPKVAALL
ncbi:DUF6473 family protein [Xinfangfangia sp. CPCC 101601]|uniref:DUF6473 family protein n=2 Tax=Pseudogemmobacter lacusdianii TaxID=3069608 RepID=A0ABU0VZT7_9RHOB|nr:DUF6473 family protein [Xinfangfangia sp. CPCC 101601]